mmetsp:Transcript_19640/g.54604  ORF Transcript_19640/g.54604 Transcript_19640/m.54604 type:complete len:182 (-) Transcript_19640:814-1359(-)|eukprot:CAMPEP_0198118826 /NCGR_PEP_ID=MMETSP1442-20131203/23229_1 /TAXON_ID= /ORGANISM="Craspedostauros australis, Strain CCMP3328" /LENGTH=181 /DNA_ID=CAMNT_0043777151 /DNA_START=40 /DNA_END=585 /DNA_ORIENTATION=+
MTMKTVTSQSQLSDVTEATDVASLSADSSIASEKDTTRVTFGNVQIREYERIVGDHPDTKIGVPLALGWHYEEQEDQTLEHYEETRTSKGMLRMSSITRKNILHQVFGIPEEELRNAEKEVQRIRKRRQHSNKQSKASAKTESAVRAFGRKMRRALTADNFLRGLSVASSGMAAPMSVGSS